MLSQNGSVYSTLQYSWSKASPSRVGSLPILDVQSKIAKRTMGDGSFLEVIVSNDFMDSALTVKKEVSVGFVV